MTSMHIGLPLKSFNAAAVAASTGTTYALPGRAVQVTWQTSFGSNPSAVSISIQTSLDNSVWTTVVTTTTTTGNTGSFLTSAAFIRAIINSATGGTLATVNLIAKAGLIDGIVTPFSVTSGSLVTYSGTTGNIFSELEFTGDANDVLLGDGTFGPVPVDGVGGLNFVGTANQITVTESPAETFTFSTPQDIATGSTPRFAGIGINTPGISGQITGDTNTLLVDFATGNFLTSIVTPLITRDSGDLTISTTTSGNIILTPATSNDVVQISGASGLQFGFTGAGAAGVFQIGDVDGMSTDTAWQVEAATGTTRVRLPAGNTLALSLEATDISGNNDFVQVFMRAHDATTTIDGTFELQNSGNGDGKGWFGWHFTPGGGNIDVFRMNSDRAFQVYANDIDPTPVIILDGLTGDITASDFIMSGSRLKSDATDAHTGGLAVYDVNGAAYRDFLVWTNGNAPAVVMSIPTTGTLDITATTCKAALQTSANATTGLVAGVLSALTNASIVIKDGSGQAYRVPVII